MLIGKSQEGISNAELQIAGFLCEHNLSFNIMDHFSDLLPKLCPDSKIAAQFQSKRTKTSSIVKMRYRLTFTSGMSTV